jgi:hypothetical protein
LKINAREYETDNLPPHFGPEIALLDFIHCLCQPEMPGSYVAMAGQEDLLNIGEREAELIGESSPVNPMPEENAIPQFIGVNQLLNARGRIFFFQPTNNLFPPRFSNAISTLSGVATWKVASSGTLTL